MQKQFSVEMNLCFSSFFVQVSNDFSLCCISAEVKSLEVGKNGVGKICLSCEIYNTKKNMLVTLQQK